MDWPKRNARAAWLAKPLDYCNNSKLTSRNRFAMRYLFAFVLFSYFLLSGYTVSENVDGALGMLDRIILADFVGIIIALLGIVTLRRVVVTFEISSFLLYLVVALVGIFGTRNPTAGVVELIVLAFNFSIALALFHVVINNRQITVSEVVQIFVLTSTILATLGFVQFMFVKDLFAEKPAGALVGTFRNTGQAGTYFGVALAVAIPAIMSGLIKKNVLNIACIVVITFALFFTFKRAALIGYSIGLVLFALRLSLSGSAGDRKTAVLFLLLCVVAGPALYLLFVYSIENIEAMRWRFEKKMNEHAIEDFSEGFFAENLDATMRALTDYPFLGAGLGNIIGQYTAKWEIHSTYLSVLANTGLTGFALYVIFITAWTMGMFRSSGSQTIEQRFLAYILPFIVGLGVSWVYTYHLRKREFWILFVITLAIRWSVEQSRAVRKVRTAGSSLHYAGPVVAMPHNPSNTGLWQQGRTSSNLRT